MDIIKVVKEIKKILGKLPAIINKIAGIKKQKY